MCRKDVQERCVGKMCIMEKSEKKGKKGKKREKTQKIKIENFFCIIWDDTFQPKKIPTLLINEDKLRHKKQADRKMAVVRRRQRDNFDMKSLFDVLIEEDTNIKLYAEHKKQQQECFEYLFNIHNTMEQGKMNSDEKVSDEYYLGDNEEPNKEEPNKELQEIR